MAKRRTALVVDQICYDVRVRVCDSFGEEAFRVEFEQTVGGSNKGAALDRGHGAVRSKPAASHHDRGGWAGVRPSGEYYFRKGGSRWHR